MTFYGTDPAQAIVAARPSGPWIPDAVFWIVVGLGTIGSWLYALVVFIFAGSCELPMRQWQIDDVRTTHLHLVVGVALVAAAAIVGAVAWRGHRVASVFAGLLACAPMVFLLLAHPDLTQWQSHFCVGGP